MSARKSYKPVAVADWPPADQAAWNRATEAGDPISGSGIAARWSKASRDNAARAYGRYIGFQKRNGRFRSVSCVGERLSEQDLCAFGRELASQLAPYHVRGIFASLGMVFAAMDPAADRSVLTAITARLARTVKCTRDIAGNLIRPHELIAIGGSMVDEAEQSEKHSWRDARLYCDGLLIMFMAYCPLRPGAVADMRFHEHLIVEGDRVTVRFPAVEGKKRRIEDVPLPDALARRILRYVTHFRPLLSMHGTQHPGAVWLTAHGNPLDSISLTKRIRHALKPRTGKNFSAHMFRHSAATFIADYAPELARMIVGLLGHSAFRTALRHYIRANQHTAVRKYQEGVTYLLRQAQRKRRRSPRRRE